MKLDPRTKELIAVGTAVAANCHFCLRYHIDLAHQNGIPEDEIAQAIDIAKDVRKVTQGKMDTLISDALTYYPPLNGWN